MQAFIQYIIIASICLSIFFLFYKLLLANKMVVKTIRVYFLVAILISMVMPGSPLTIRITMHTTDQSTVDNNSAEMVVHGEMVHQGAIVAADTTSIDYFNIAMYIYLAITIFLLVRLCIHCYRLVACYKRSPKEKAGAIQIVWNSSFKNPFSFFKWVFVNKAHVGSNDMEKVLAHEQVHATQLHSIDTLLMELLLALMWFNPFIWKMRNAVQLVHEYLADEGVLNAGIDKVQYQQLLLNHIIETNYIPVSSALNHSLIKKRFLMMSTMNPAPATKYKLLFMAPITGLLLLGIGCVNGQTVADNPKVVTAVAPVKMNVLYIGIENPVNISVSGYTSNEVQVQIDNGKIEGSSGEYVVKPKTPGKAMITVSANGKVVKETAFRVKFLPEPVVALNPPAGSSRLIKGGAITKEALLKAGGIMATVESAEFDVPIKVASFAMGTITTGNNQTTEETSDGGNFSTAQLNIIKSLDKGQKIIIDDIAASGPDGKARKMPVSMVFTIVE
jgi:hypothetical protein